MCQGEIEKLCNASQSCHVRKVARLLARPLSLTRDYRPTSKKLVITKTSITIGWFAAGHCIKLLVGELAALLA
jgi:hypothetical protein